MLFRSPSRQQTGELAFAAVLSPKDDTGSEPHQKPTPKIVPRPLSDVKKLQSVAGFTPASSGERAVPIAPAEHPSPMLVAAAPAASSQMAAAPPSAVSDKPAPTFTPPQAPVESPQIAEPYVADSAPVRELAVRIAPPGRLPVDVRVHQQRGETHVVVRAGEETTRAILRQDLPRLVTALDRAGFHTETFADTESKASTFTGDSDNNRGSFRDSSPSDFSRNSAGNPSQSGQHQQRHREQLHSYWLEQMES